MGFRKKEPLFWIKAWFLLFSGKMSLYTKSHRSYKKKCNNKAIHFKFRIQVKYLKTYNNNKNTPDQFYYIHLDSALSL